MIKTRGIEYYCSYLTKTERGILPIFIKYCLDSYGISDDVSVEFDFDTMFIDENVSGEIVRHTDRKYAIHISTRKHPNVTQLAFCLAHEITHLEQYLNSNLLEEHKKACENNIQYSKRWYEIEANDMAKFLLNKFLGYVKELQNV